ncbi:putative transcription factor C2H2 family [Helianthus anomalus]
MRFPKSSSSRDNDVRDFECNICFELAEDPIVTVCGHLFCWPCLYKWLHIHSQSHECLYGRGKTQTDPRSKCIPGVDIPHRPAGQRPATAPPDINKFSNSMFGGFAPIASARFRNFAFSTGIGGLFPSLAEMNVHGFQNLLRYGM